MAEGGIVRLPQMTPIAREMAAMGRNGDTMLAHITPQEAMMLQRMGGSGTINPYTGLPEFFLKKLFRGIGKAIKGVARGIKKFAKSTVGRIVLSVALGAFLGPMATGFLSGTMGVTVSAAAATGISAGIGVFGSSLLAGDGFKNSLRNGLTAGALSFGVAGVTQGFSAPATNAPANFAQGYEQGLDNITSPFRKAADFIRGGPESSVGTAKDFVTQPAVTDPRAVDLIAGDVPGPVGPGPDAFGSQTANADFLANKAVDPTTLQPSRLQVGDVPGAGDVYAGQDFGIKAGVDPVTSKAFPQGRSPLPGVAPSSITGPELGAPFPRDISGATTGAERGFFDKTMDFFSPSAREAAGKEAAERAFQETLDRTKSTALAEKAYQAALPGTISKYLPAASGITAVGIGTGVLPDPFKIPEQQPNETYAQYMARIEAAQAQFKQERPEFFGSFLASPNQGIMSTQPAYSFQPVMTAAKGSGPKGVEDFPRKNGAINGPGTGTSDDIPAMLSDGEFVFTAKSVRNMGGGSRRKGAAKMYKLMKMLEGGPVGKTAKA
jgi:hypothetical protein